MTKPAERCVESVPNGGRSVSSHQCPYKGILEYNGEKYCRLHHPPTTEAKNDERYRQYVAELEREKTTRAKAGAIREAEQRVLKAAMRPQSGRFNQGDFDDACYALEALGWEPES